MARSPDRVILLTFLLVRGQLLIGILLACSMTNGATASPPTNVPAVCRTALAIVAVTWFQPWDLVLAVKEIFGAFSVAYVCVFASGVLVGSFFIPIIMVRR